MHVCVRPGLEPNHPPDQIHGSHHPSSGPDLTRVPRVQCPRASDRLGLSPGTASQGDSGPGVWKGRPPRQECVHGCVNVGLRVDMCECTSIPGYRCTACVTRMYTHTCTVRTGGFAKVLQAQRGVWPCPSSHSPGGPATGSWDPPADSSLGRCRPCLRFLFILYL